MRPDMIDYLEAMKITDRAELLFALVLAPTEEELAAMCAGAHPPYINNPNECEQ